MHTDATNQQIVVMFNGLRRKSAAIPPAGSLSAKLSRVVDSASGKSSAIDAETLTLFATASVEMWHRAIHSFIVSASLAKASPLWASVSGYYSSHYSIRAFAHLLGYFRLRSKKQILRVEAKGAQYICHLNQQPRGDGEHKFYWKTVKNHAKFVDNPLFTTNDERQPRSDCGHRNKANYADHIDQFPAFQILDEPYLKQRVEKIASMQLSDAPIPRTESYPDVDYVQLIAYHRITTYRKIVDDALGISHRFWRVHREPSWCRSFLDFQVMQPEYTAIFREKLT